MLSKNRLQRTLFFFENSRIPSKIFINNPLSLHEA
jgi:hypothetical protein